VSSASPVTDITINTNGSVYAGGNITANKAFQSKSVIVENDVTINSGSLTMNSENSVLTCPGKFILGGELVMSDFNSSAIINASYVQTWETSSSSNLIVQITDGSYVKKDASVSGTIVGGLLSLQGRSGVILDWSSYGSDSQHMLDTIMLDTAGITVGHKLLVIAKLGSNTSVHTFKLVPNTIAYPSGKVLNGINFTESYNTVELIFDGTNWIVVNLLGAVLDYE
jgi:hypothetical protein